MASSFNGTLYTGVTSNLVGRIIRHREGTFGGFTKRYRVRRLVWFETADTMDAVIAAEKRIKKWSRDYKKNLIERGSPAWDDLAIGLGLPPLE